MERAIEHRFEYEHHRVENRPDFGKLKCSLVPRDEDEVNAATNQRTSPTSYSYTSTNNYK